jgi:PIN domain nuclease of toxin-antitoxin system
MLLDTHAVVWLAYRPERLSVPASRAIQNAEDASVRLAVSSVSIDQMASLIDQRTMRVSVNRKDFLDEVRRRFVILPVDGDML